MQQWAHLIEGSVVSSLSRFKSADVCEIKSLLDIGACVALLGAAVCLCCEAALPRALSSFCSRVLTTRHAVLRFFGSIFRSTETVK